MYFPPREKTRDRSRAVAVTANMSRDCARNLDVATLQLEPSLYSIRLTLTIPRLRYA